MVILGGLELVAAGYLLREHGKNKKEKQRIEQEEERIRYERKQQRRRRRHSGSPDDDDRRGRSDKKYDYVPPSTLRPPNASSSTLGVPPGPPGRSTSQPPPGYTPNANPPYPPNFSPPPPNQPGAPPPQGYSYGQYPPPFPPPPSQQGQGLSAEYYNPNNKYGPDDTRHRSDSEPNLPVGIAELSADGPWMHDPHRTSHQTPHVRFNFPDDSPQPGDDRRPPPAYRP